MNFSFYVDESGQSGIKKIRDAKTGGASAYMTLGGVLVPSSYKETIADRLSDLASEFNRQSLHCSKLNHNQIVRFCQVIAEERVLLFGVISLKKTLGKYADEIDGDDKKFYNKNAQYLLERLAHFMEKESLGEKQLTVCFEEGNYDYGALRGLIALCRKNPIWSATKRLTRINPQSISATPKDGEPLLQIADLVAHALFRCVDNGPSTFGVKETRYINELRTKFFSGEESGRIVKSGIFPVHKLGDIKADRDVELFFQSLTNR